MHSVGHTGASIKGNREDLFPYDLSGFIMCHISIISFF